MRHKILQTNTLKTNFFREKKNVEDIFLKFLTVYAIGALLDSRLSSERVIHNSGFNYIYANSDLTYVTFEIKQFQKVFKNFISGLKWFININHLVFKDFCEPCQTENEVLNTF